MSELATKDASDGEGGVLRGARLEQLKKKLSPGWTMIKQEYLEKEFKFKDFNQALAYTNKVGEVAESMGHHPDIFLGWGQVKLKIWTHSKGGLTESDFVLAAKIDAIR
jgi:4a-hydroxytetrahydrobiopterin dehydratase